MIPSGQCTYACEACLYLKLLKAQTQYLWSEVARVATAAILVSLISVIPVSRYNQQVWLFAGHCFQLHPPL